MTQTHRPVRISTAHSPLPTLPPKRGTVGGGRVRSAALLGLTLTVLAAGWLREARAQESGRPAVKTKIKAKAAGEAAAPIDPEREAAALAFVGEHHPELANLLERLKAMRPGEYAQAIRELAQVSRNLSTLRGRDPRRYALGLEVWKTRSRVDLLTARLAASAQGSSDLESQLRQALADQIAAEARQQRFERDQVRARLRRLEEALGRLEADPAALAESRYQAVLKKSQRARREARTAGTARGRTPGNGALAAPGPANTSSKSDAPPMPMGEPNPPVPGDTPPTPRPETNPTKGDRQP